MRPTIDRSQAQRIANKWYDLGLTTEQQHKCVDEMDINDADKNLIREYIQ